MNVNLTCIMLILDSIPSQDIRKKDAKCVKLLVQKQEFKLPQVLATKNHDIKEQIRYVLVNAIGTDDFHLEQVYTLGDKQYMFNDTVDVVHLGITNISRIKKISADYKIIDAMISDNKITLGDTIYKYQTVEKISPHSIEYTHTIDNVNIATEKMLIELLTAWKHLQYRLNTTDIIFKFLPDEFALNDAVEVYKILSQKEIDKSNFRKSIIKFCENIPDKMSYGGYRPCKMYKFNPKKNEKWI